jgi:arabinogalactan oligomer / maltooligosaccharide transport system permease protein
MSTSTETTPVAFAKPPFRFGKWFMQTGWRHLIGLVFTVYAVFPLLYVLSASLNPNGSLTGSNALFSNVTFDAYAGIVNNPKIPFLNWYLNTMVVGVITSVCTVFLGALAAYSFSRMRFRGRRSGLLVIVLLQMFPQLLTIVAIFIVMNAIGEIFPAIGLNTHAGLILVYLGGALGVNTFLMYGYFNTVPSDIDEAAKIDGAGHARIFFTMILRLVAPILAVVGLLAFIGVTGDFVIASIMLIDPEKQTLAVGLFRLVADDNYKQWNLFAAGAVLAAIPVTALFLFLQRYIVGGLTAGSVK